MPRASRVTTGLPPQSKRALESLGRDIAIARKRRKITQRLMAERMFVSVQTVQRLESGDPTVGIAVLASALFVLGFTKRLAELAAPDSDQVGMREELARLPTKTHSTSPKNLDF